MAILLTVTPALAQSDQIENRLNRLENEISTLGRAVYRGDKTVTTSFGMPSMDVRKQSADDLVRIQQLETELRDLNGKLEAQAYEIRMLRSAFEKANSDMALRLSDLEKGVLKPAAIAPAKATEAEKTSPVSTQETAASSPQPKTLGTLKLSSSESERLDTIASANEPESSGSANADYEQAFNLVKKGQYAQAQAAFENFLKNYPDDKLAGNAQYWLGETFYVREKYTEAARLFAEGFQKYPKGAKAADNLLKLGVTLGVMGKTEDACIALSQVEKEFPVGASSARRRAQQEMTRLGC